MAVDQIRVNGNVLSYGSIKVRVADQTIYGLTSVSYGDKRERVKVYGLGRHQAPRGRTRGKYTVENAKLGGYTSTIQDLRKLLADMSADGISYGDVEFDVVVEMVERDETPCTVELLRCVWAANTESREEGGDPLKDEIELDVMMIRRDGLVLCDASEGTP
jgi:hypothetical protein